MTLPVFSSRLKSGKCRPLQQVWHYGNWQFTCRKVEHFDKIRKMTANRHTI